jgi:hypothetical protein
MASLQPKEAEGETEVALRQAVKEEVVVGDEKGA